MFFRRTQSASSNVNSLTPLIISMAVIFTWVSLWVSYSPTQVSDAEIETFMKQRGQVPVQATGGYPLTTFKYPVSPLGNNFPNPDAFFPLVLNLVFWTAVSTIIISVVSWKLPVQRITPVIIGLACLLTIFEIFGLALTFD